METGKRSGDSKDILKFRSFSTGKYEIACEALQTIFGKEEFRIDVHGNSDEFKMRFACATLGTLTLMKSEVSSYSLTRFPTASTFIKIPLHGSPLNYRAGTRRQEAFPSHGAGVGRPFETVNMTQSQGSGLVLCAPVARLIQRAERLSGLTYGSALASRMVDYIDLSAPICAALARVMKSTMAEIVNLNSIGLGALAVAGFEDLLLNLAVGSLFPGVVQKTEETSLNCSPSAVRRARDHIAAHAAEPIDLLKLASGLGVSMRAMQENFRKCYGLSPRDYILQCRLELARRRLLAADSTASVTQAALASGFTDLGHFSAKYRARFGELPSETLRLALRQFS